MEMKVLESMRKKFYFLKLDLVETSDKVEIVDIRLNMEILVIYPI